MRRGFQKAVGIAKIAVAEGFEPVRPQSDDVFQVTKLFWVPMKGVVVHQVVNPEVGTCDKGFVDDVGGCLTDVDRPP